MASRKRPHDSTNGINHDLEGIDIRNGDSNSGTAPELFKNRSNSRAVSFIIIINLRYNRYLYFNFSHRFLPASINNDEMENQHVNKSFK